MCTLPETGARYRWRFSADSPITAGAALSGDVAYLAGHDGRVCALSLATGDLLARSEPLGGKLAGGAGGRIGLWERAAN